MCSAQNLKIPKVFPDCCGPSPADQLGIDQFSWSKVVQDFSLNVILGRSEVIHLGANCHKLAPEQLRIRLNKN